MTRVLVGSVAIVALTVAGHPAAAADIGGMPTKAPVFAPIPVQNWTGFYVGANAGYSWGRTGADYTLGGVPIGSTTLEPNSFVGGGQIGYNWQLGSVVLGIEGDVAWRGGSDNATFTSGNVFGDFATVNSEQNWIGTVRPRVGFAAQNWLVYGTGGLAFGGLQHGLTESRPGVVTRATTDSNTKTGWAAGGGVEYAFTNQWSLGVEYLYADFGSTTLNQPAAAPLPPSTATFDDNSHLLRAKLNFKLNWNSPLTGK